MACSDCYPGSSTVIVAGEGTTVSGTGTVENPYRINTEEVINGDLQESIVLTAAPDLNLDALARPVTVRATLTGDGTVVLPSGWGTGVSGSVTLVLTQGPGGGHTMNFGAALSMAPIVLSTGVGAIDVVILMWTGQDWIATLTNLNVQ